MAHIQSPDVRRALERLEPEDQAEFRDLMLQVITESGEEDMVALDHIARFLSYNGVGIQFRRQHKEEEEDILAEFRAMEAEDPIEDEEEGTCNIPDLTRV